MTNDYHNNTDAVSTPPHAFTMTYEQRLDLEDRLVEVVCDVIDRDMGDISWPGPTCRLMELAWAMSRLHRIIDHATGRPMTMQHLATRLCKKLGRRLPTNIYSVARQSLLSGRPSVIDCFGSLWYESGIDPKALLLGTGAKDRFKHDLTTLSRSAS